LDLCDFLAAFAHTNRRHVGFCSSPLSHIIISCKLTFFLSYLSLHSLAQPCTHFYNTLQMELFFTESWSLCNDFCRCIHTYICV
jgi:hypothetical protein